MHVTCARNIAGIKTGGLSVRLHQPNNMRALVYRSSGKTQTLVMDGVTLGYPVCKEPSGCKVPLSSQRDEYCHIHHSLLKKCVVVGCLLHADTGYRTCGTPPHRAIEKKRSIKKKAIFQLKHRFQRDGGVDDEAGSDSDGSSSDGDDGADPSASSDTKLRAQFGRERTHNEFVCLRPCGIITCRAPMWGSEALSGVKVSYLNPSLMF